MKRIHPAIIDSTRPAPARSSFVELRIEAPRPHESPRPEPPQVRGRYEDESTDDLFTVDFRI
jgi:hypothetical protein